MNNPEQRHFSLYAALCIVPVLFYAVYIPQLTDTAWFASNAVGWFTMTDYSSNGYFLWKLNPLYSLLTAWAGYKGYYLLVLTIFLFGIFKSAKDSEASSVSLFVSGFLAPVTLFCLFGINLPIMSLASLCTLILWIALKPSPKILDLLLVGLLASFTTQLLSVLLLFPLISLYLYRSDPSKRLLQLGILSLFLILPSFLAPHLVNPDYPQSGHLIPGYGSLFGLDPIISFGPKKPFIDRFFTQNFPIIPCFITLITGLWILFTTGICSARSLAFTTVIMSVVVLLDTDLFPAEVQLISPLQALSRIIPGLISYPLPLYATGLSVVLLGLLSLFPRHTVSAAVSLALLCGYGIHSTAGSNNLHFGTLANPVDHLENAAINSPSLYLLRHRPEALHELSSPYTAKPLSAFSPKLSASQNSEFLTAITNDKKRDRWSTKLSSQNGTEWIQIELPVPSTIKGIDLSVPKFYSDFPRGLEIRGGASCATLSTLLREPQWLGSTKVTPSGLPYYTHESIIEVHFAPVMVQCLLIKQIGRDPAYEWSIESIQLLQ